MRLILSGSAPLSTVVIEEFTARTGIPIHQGYGLTEASPVVTSTLRSEKLQNGSVGAALDGVEIRLVDEAGRPLTGDAEDDPGEIQIKGANLFSGYWPEGADGPDAQGWWSTGDVGFLDPSGDLFLVDRLKEMVIVSGFNVYPTEVEDVIRDVPGVRETAVIGVEDPTSGEAVVAYVVPTATTRRGGRGARAVPGTAGALQAAEPDRGGRRAAAHRHRQGPEGPAAQRRAAPRAGHPRMSARVTVYTRPGCHLCEEALEVVAKVCADLGESYDEVDIDEDADLTQRFGEEIPVTFVDGQQHDFWRVSEDRLRAALGA